MTIAEAPIKCVTCAMLNDDGKPVHEECYVPKAKAEHKVIFELPVGRSSTPNRSGIAPIRGSARRMPEPSASIVRWKRPLMK